MLIRTLKLHGSKFELMLQLRETLVTSIQCIYLGCVWDYDFVDKKYDLKLNLKS
jgi:hypothetical protein